MAKELLPPPVLNPVPTYLASVWHLFKYFIVAAIAGGVIMLAMIYSGIGITMPMWMAFRFAGAITVCILGLGVVTSLLSPQSMSWEEMLYRKRLERAMAYFLNKEQYEADIDELGKTIDDLKASMTPEEFAALKLSNQDILDRTVDRARTKA